MSVLSHPLQPFALERYFAQYEFNIEHLLCQSDCETWTVGSLLDLEPNSREIFEEMALGYTQSAGDPDLRQAIANTYTNLTADDVLVHSGAEEAIYNAMVGLLNPGDHLIVQVPCYESLIAVAQAHGCDITPWAVNPDKGWELNVDELDQSRTSKTKMVVVNMPHNPTGYLPDRTMFDGVVNWCRSHNVILFSDEVYRGLEYRKDDRLPAACEVYENAMSLGVMSKTYGLPGLRIGWIATRNNEMYDRMAAMKDYTTICNSAPSEFLATIALTHGETLIQRNRDLVVRNLKILDMFFEKYGKEFGWHKPKAGPISFMRLKGEETAEAFCQRMVKQGILFVPGTCFPYGDNHHVRIGFGKAKFAESWKAFESVLNTN